MNADRESVGYVFKCRNFCLWKEKPSLISLIGFVKRFFCSFHRNDKSDISNSVVHMD